MDKISCVYIIKSKDRPKNFYVGSTSDFRKRKREHLCNLRGKKHHSSILQCHVNKYGLDDLYFEVLEEVSEEEIIIEREQYYIDALCPKFNVSLKAGKRVVFNISDETRNRMKLAWTDERRKKFSESQKGNKRGLGTKRSESFCKALRERTKGRIVSEDQRRRHSLAMKGFRHSDEAKMKISKSGKGRVICQQTREKIRKKLIGHTVSLESRRKIREKLIGRVAPTAKKVIDLSTGKIYECTRLAAKDLNLNSEGLRKKLCGNRTNNTSLIYL